MTRIIIISWNVRGANGGEKRTLIKALLKTQKADLICLQKTKFKGISSSLIRSLGVGDLWIRWHQMRRGLLAMSLSFGILRCFSFLKWRKVVSHFLASSEIVRTASPRSSQVSMGPFLAVLGKLCRRSWVLLDGCGGTLVCWRGF